MTTLSITSKIQKVELKTTFSAQQGVSGPPGKSAYELALENGFVGDETSWLASLEVEGLFENYPDDLLVGYEIAKL